jgi:hypothetical protein
MATITKFNGTTETRATFSEFVNAITAFGEKHNKEADYTTNTVRKFFALKDGDIGVFEVSALPVLQYWYTR